MKRVVKKTTTKEWGEDAITDALNRCKSGMSVRKAATLCKVPQTTLSRRLKGRSNPWGKAPQLDENDELKLIQYTVKIRNVAHIIMCAIGYYRYVFREAHIKNESSTLHKLCVLIKLYVLAECVRTGIGQQDPKIYGIK